MGKQWDDQDFTIDDALDGSDLVKDLRRVIKNLQSKSSDLETEVKGYRTTARVATVAEVLKANGLSEAVAKFVPADVEGDALNDWIKENAEIFGGVKPAEDPAGSEDPPADPAEVASRERMATLSGKAATPVPATDWAARIKAANTPAELNTVLAEAAAAGM